MSLVEKAGIQEGNDGIQKGFYDYWSAQPVTTQMFWSDFNRARIFQADFSASISDAYGEGFVHIKIEHQFGDKVGMGPGQRYDQTGSVVVSLYTEQERSRYLPRDLLIDQAVAFFNQGTVNGVFFWNAVPRGIGEIGRWVQDDIIATFLYVVNRGN